jgi:hypothetical protein
MWKRRDGAKSRVSPASLGTRLRANAALGL